MGEVKISKAYCFELNKVVNTEQARAAFFSSDNTEYDKFNFYCYCCGIRYKAKNILTKQKINPSVHNKPHFAVYYTGDIHTDPLCEHLNDEKRSVKPSKGNNPSGSEEFYHSHFLSSPIKSGIISGLTGMAPDMMDKDIVKNAENETFEYNIEQTSIFEDIVTNYIKLKEVNKTGQHLLKIDDSFEKTTTYENVFLEWKKIAYYFIYDKSQDYFKYRIFHGKIHNNNFKDDGENWSFILDFNVDKIELNGKKIISRILFPTDVLNSNLPTKNFFESQRKKNYSLDKCYLVGTVPKLIEVENTNGIGTHHEVHFVVTNPNYIVITFKDSINL